jgi:hypothetical protein
MDIHGQADARFGPVRDCFAEVADGYGMGGLGGNYGGTCTDGGYTIGFVTGSVGNFDRADALENALRGCLGLPPLPASA